MDHATRSHNRWQDTPRLHERMGAPSQVLSQSSCAPTHAVATVLLSRRVSPISGRPGRGRLRWTRETTGGSWLRKRGHATPDAGRAAHPYPYGQAGQAEPPLRRPHGRAPARGAPTTATTAAEHAFASESVAPGFLVVRPGLGPGRTSSTEGQKHWSPHNYPSVSRNGHGKTAFSHE